MAAGFALLPLASGVERRAFYFYTNFNKLYKIIFKMLNKGKNYN
jgi:hypothetical protein